MAAPRRTTGSSHFDVIVIGTGMGGGTFAYTLAGSGASVLMIERGDFLPQEPSNWDPAEVFQWGRYKNAERWYPEDGSSFSPGTYYYVGGNTKFYGASLPRFRREDFQAVEHADGVSPEWPLVLAKADADVNAVRPALRSRNTQLLTRA